MIECDALAVLAHAHHAETEIRLIALLIEVQSDKLSSDKMDKDTANACVEERQPEHIAVDSECFASNRNGERSGEVPQNDGECAECCDLFQCADKECQGQRNELINILTDTLIGVVRIAAEHLQTVVDLSVHPAREVVLRHPCTPADCQHLPQIDGVDGNDDVKKSESCERTDERPEGSQVVRLECIVEVTIPIMRTSRYTMTRLSTMTEVSSPRARHFSAELQYPLNSRQKPRMRGSFTQYPPFLNERYSL